MCVVLWMAVSDLLQTSPIMRRKTHELFRIMLANSSWRTLNGSSTYLVTRNLSCTLLLLQNEIQYYVITAEENVTK